MKVICEKLVQINFNIDKDSPKAAEVYLYYSSVLAPSDYNLLLTMVNIFTSQKFALREARVLANADDNYKITFK